MPDGCDACPGFNDALDADGDGVPNGCDACPGADDTVDSDSDGVPDGCDVCPGYNDGADADSDTVPDGCDACPGSDDAVDGDGDGVPDGCDACPGFNDALDADSDGVPNGCDICPGGDDGLDADSDSVPDGCDICPGGDDGVDSDGDTVPDGCDACPGFDDDADSDGDAVPDGCDVCPGGNDNLDTDSDGVPNACDACPGSDDNNDADSDSVPDGCDICPGFDDDADSDGDGVPDGCDFCVMTYTITGEVEVTEAPITPSVTVFPGQGPGTVILRVPDSGGGVPGDGPAAILYYQMPAFFDVDVIGTTISSALVTTAGSFGNRCPLNSGTFSASSSQIVWGACDYGPSHCTTSWTFSNQNPPDITPEVGCLPVHQTGTINCGGGLEGFVCGMANLAVGDNPVDETWFQPQNISQFQSNYTTIVLDGTGGPDDSCCAGTCPDKLENPNVTSSRTWLGSVSSLTDIVCDELPPICP